MLFTAGFFISVVSAGLLSSEVSRKVLLLASYVIVFFSFILPYTFVAIFDEEFRLTTGLGFGVVNFVFGRPFIYVVMVGLAVCTILWWVAKKYHNLIFSILDYTVIIVRPSVVFIVGYFYAIITFAIAYYFIDRSCEVGLRSLTGQDVFDYFYFSIVTFSTLGYGDIQPGCTGAKMVASAEVVVGQFYLLIGFAAIIAYLRAPFRRVSREHERQRVGGGAKKVVTVDK
jgi:hypothetical protein